MRVIRNWLWQCHVSLQIAVQKQNTTAHKVLKPHTLLLTHKSNIELHVKY